MRDLNKYAEADRKAIYRTRRELVAPEIAQLHDEFIENGGGRHGLYKSNR